PGSRDLDSQALDSRGLDTRGLESRGLGSRGPGSPDPCSRSLVPDEANNSPTKTKGTTEPMGAAAHSAPRHEAPARRSGPRAPNRRRAQRKRAAARNHTILANALQRADRPAQSGARAPQADLGHDRTENC